MFGKVPDEATFLHGKNALSITSCREHAGTVKFGAKKQFELKTDQPPLVCISNVSFGVLLIPANASGRGRNTLVQKRPCS